MRAFCLQNTLSIVESDCVIDAIQLEDAEDAASWSAAPPHPFHNCCVRTSVEVVSGLFYLQTYVFDGEPRRSRSPFGWACHLLVVHGLARLMDQAPSAAKYFSFDGTSPALPTRLRHLSPVTAERGRLRSRIPTVTAMLGRLRNPRLAEGQLAAGRGNNLDPSKPTVADTAFTLVARVSARASSDWRFNLLVPFPG